MLYFDPALFKILQSLFKDDVWYAVLQILNIYFQMNTPNISEDTGYPAYDFLPSLNQQYNT